VFKYIQISFALIELAICVTHLLMVKQFIDIYILLKLLSGSSRRTEAPTGNVLTFGFGV